MRKRPAALGPQPASNGATAAAARAGCGESAGPQPAVEPNHRMVEHARARGARGAAARPGRPAESALIKSDSTEPTLIKLDSTEPTQLSRPQPVNRRGGKSGPPGRVGPDQIRADERERQSSRLDPDGGSLPLTLAAGRRSNGSTPVGARPRPTVGGPTPWKQASLDLTQLTGQVVNWSTGQLVNWSTGQLVNWSTG